MSNAPPLLPVLIAVATDMLGLARLPRVLHMAGCRVTVVAPDNLLVHRSRFVDHRVRTPSGLEEVAESLKRHLESCKDEYVWTIIGDEPLLRELSKRRQEEWVKPIFPVDLEGEGPDIITSKTAFALAAARAGLPVPPFCVCTTLEEAKAGVRGLGLPVAMKESWGSGGIEVRIVSASEAIPDAFESLEDGKPLLLQAFVSGIVGSTEVLYNHGNPVCWNSSYTIETYPLGTGASCIRKVTIHPAIEQIVKDVGTLLGFHGFGGIDWIHDTSRDVLKLIEFNPRPTPGYHFGYLGNVDFSRAVRSMLEGRETVQKPGFGVDGTSGPVVSMFPQYLNRLIDSRNVSGLMKWFFGRSLVKDVPWDDPSLFLAHVGRVWQKFMGDVKKALRRRFGN